MSGRSEEARERYAAVAATLATGAGEGSARSGREDDLELSVDVCIKKGFRKASG